MGGRTGKRANPKNLCHCGHFAVAAGRVYVTPHKTWVHSRGTCGPIEAAPDAELGAALIGVKLPISASFPPGARVLLDGCVVATVLEAFPEGSTSYVFPHYRLRVVGGDENIAVRWDRVGVGSP